MRPQYLGRVAEIISIKKWKGPRLTRQPPKSAEQRNDNRLANRANFRHHFSSDPDVERSGTERSYKSSAAVFAVAIAHVLISKSSAFGALLAALAAAELAL